METQEHSEKLESPILLWRKKMKLSQAKMAELLNISMTTYVRLEQCTYDRIPPKILWYIAAHSGGVVSIASDYIVYQANKRRESARQNVLTHDLPPIWGTEPDNQIHPFIQWREHYSGLTRLQFCVYYCAHYSTITRFEAGITKEVPQQLLDILSECGYSSDVLTELTRRYNVWRQYYRTDYHVPREAVRLGF